MKVYTKTGDKGTTALLGGTRVPKNHIRIEAYGTVDELNSFIGLIRDYDDNEEREETLLKIQDKLFVLGAELATDPQKKNVKKPVLFLSDVEFLEKRIDAYEETLPALKNFILPGGHPAVSTAHIARCVCRRAERLVIGIQEIEGGVDAVILQYLNRLSDFLFVLSRKICFDKKIVETIWKPER